jgi:hypothetical protein
MPKKEALSKERLIKLGTARDEIELALWRDILAQDGIPTLVKNVDALASTYYVSALPYSLEVYVRASDEVRARWLLGLQAEA